MRILALLIGLSILTSCAFPHNGSPPPGPNSPATFRGAGHTEVLIYGGEGSWPAEIQALKDILYEHDQHYEEVSSQQLNQMSVNELASYDLLVIPGGNAYTITDSLSAQTHARLRQAVQERGLDYLGFCAGAWIAVGPAPLPGEDVKYGLGLVDGPLQEFSYLEKQGREFGISRAQFPDGSHRDLLWYGGPVTPNVAGGVIAKYPDGTPAITQMSSGKGLVIASGLHPASNMAILNSLGINDPEAIAPDFAWKMLDAGIHQTRLQSF